MEIDTSYLLRSRCSVLTMVLLAGLCVSARSEVTITEVRGGVTVKTETDTLRLTVCGPTVIHVVASPTGDAQDATLQQPWMIEPCAVGSFKLTMSPVSPITAGSNPPPSPPAATLDTGSIRILISLDSGSLQFNDEQDHRVLREEHDAPRWYQPVIANGESLYQVTDSFSSRASEGVFGLGQHQNGLFNYRGAVIELAQVNTDVAIPLLVSTKGYGLFWNTAAKSYFDNRFPSQMRWSAEAAHAIDYYFIYGPEIDQIIHQYRMMTGHVPLFPEWAYGFFQSKDRYKSVAELLEIANEYRSSHVPLDVIVQDWFWWVHRGDPEFRPGAYSDLHAKLDLLHQEHVHLMLSIWPLFDPDSETYRQMSARSLIIPGTADYDPTNPASRDFYWDHLAGKELGIGWDAFWLDASEPESGNPQGDSNDPVLSDKKLFLGNGALYANIFPLMHTENIYQHWRETTDQKRVFLLTRSAFAGQQRNAMTVWSGDVYSTFHAFSRQLPAGLNFAISGMPYWTTDIAGYSSDGTGRSTTDPSYQELYVRWFEFGVFCPIFRTHGHRQNDVNELFSYGPVTPILERYDKLRYRLLPYIYSLAWDVTHNDGTIMRPLVMDWRTDEKVWDIGDQFMFGPSILVSPVTQEGATSRWLYLPPAPGWYDFWTGRKTQGDQRVKASAALDRIPLYVKAGTILPLGPEVEYAGEKPDAPIVLRVYRGADATFDLYQDAGDSYAYEHGAHCLIPMRWNDATGQLSIGARAGHYPGMPQMRTFRIIFVGENHGVGPDELSAVDREVTYRGDALTVEAPHQQ